MLAPDGRVELLGQRQRALGQLTCRMGLRVLPYAVCQSRLEEPGLLAAALHPAKAP